jgi:hypothetical protein
MGMTVTTSDGTRDKSGHLDWMFDPTKVDGDRTGISWSAGAMSVLDAFVATELLEEGQSPPSEGWPVGEAHAAVTEALASTDIQSDDYLYPRLLHILTVLNVGIAKGATRLIAD